MLLCLEHHLYHNVVLFNKIARLIGLIMRQADVESTRPDLLEKVTPLTYGLWSPSDRKLVKSSFHQQQPPVLVRPFRP
jgi:hypothetical protein